MTSLPKKKRELAETPLTSDLIDAETRNKIEEQLRKFEPQCRASLESRKGKPLLGSDEKDLAVYMKAARLVLLERALNNVVESKKAVE